MFILTTDNRMINAAHLSMIRRVYSGIEAYSPETQGAITLAMYDTEEKRLGCSIVYLLQLGRD